VFLLCGLEAPYHFNIINLGEAALWTGGRLTILTSSILEKLLCGLEAPYHFNIINLGEAALWTEGSLPF
jgi:hypothetical protein